MQGPGQMRSMFNASIIHERSLCYRYDNYTISKDLCSWAALRHTIILSQISGLGLVYAIYASSKGKPDDRSYLKFERHPGHMVI
jgi:hypothetical protein